MYFLFHIIQISFQTLTSSLPILPSTAIYQITKLSHLLIPNQNGPSTCSSLNFSSSPAPLWPWPIQRPIATGVEVSGTAPTSLVVRPPPAPVHPSEVPLAKVDLAVVSLAGAGLAAVGQAVVAMVALAVHPSI